MREKPDLGDRPAEEFESYLVCGISFHRSSVEVREKCSVPTRAIAAAFDFLMSRPGVKECMVLSTCNRTELYLSAEPWVDGVELFRSFSRTVLGFDPSDRRGTYSLRGIPAIRHSFRVAASLDSLVVGEPQILGQMKSAFREAEGRHSIERDLHRWIPRAFAAAKQVRSETGISESAVSVSYAAVQLARKIFEDLTGKSVVLLGAGKMSELAAKHLKEAGASSIVVANRTLSHAEALAGKCSGIAVEFERRAERIAAADVVICSTDAPHYVLSREDVVRIRSGRGDRPLLLLDISVPRNIDPKAADLEGVYLFNVDDLDRVVQANRENRRAAAARADTILEKAIERFLQEEKSSRMAPAIAAIRNQVRSICDTELERLQRKLPDMTNEQREELELMLHRIAQKIVHPAIMELKALESRESAPARKSLIERLFGVQRKPAKAGP